MLPLQLPLLICNVGEGYEGLETAVSRQKRIVPVKRSA